MITSMDGERLVLCQEWTEYERGWGCRPDGCTIHLSEEDHKAYCREYWDRMPKHEVPDEYSAECGTPYIAVISGTLYNRLEQNKARHGILTFEREIIRKAGQDELLGRLTGQGPLTEE